MSYGLFIDPEGTGLPSVRQEKLSPLPVCFSAGIAEHMMVFVCRVVVDLQQHDRALFQGFFHGVRCDPRVKTDPDTPAEPCSPQTAPHKDAGEEIGGASEVPQKILVPVDPGAPADLRKLQKQVLAALVGPPLFFQTPLQGAHYIYCSSGTAVAFVTVLQVHELTCRTIGSKGDPCPGSPFVLSGHFRAFFCPGPAPRQIPAAGLLPAAGICCGIEYLIYLFDHMSFILPYEFILHRAIPVISIAGHTRKKETLSIVGTIVQSPGPLSGTDTQSKAPVQIPAQAGIIY